MTKNNQAGCALVIGIIVALLVVGGGAAIYFATKDSDDDSKNTTTESNETKAETAVESKALPADYPAEAAPTYQPSINTLASKVGEGWMIYAETKDDINDVAESILKEYKALGANVTQTPVGEEEPGVGQVVGGSNGYGVIITYSTEDGKDVTGISYHVEPQIDR